MAFLRIVMRDKNTPPGTEEAGKGRPPPLGGAKDVESPHPWPLSRAGARGDRLAFVRTQPGSTRPLRFSHASGSAEGRSPSAGGLGVSPSFPFPLGRGGEGDGSIG